MTVKEDAMVEFGDEDEIQPTVMNLGELTSLTQEAGGLENGAVEVAG